MKKLASLLLIVLAPISYSWSETFIIKDPTKSDSDFQAHLLADSTLKSISNWMLQQDKYKAQKYGLEQKFIDIKDALKKDQQGTHKLLQEVYFNRHNYEWTNLQRKILTEVILLLSEAEVHPLKKQKLVEEAKSFHPDLQKTNTKKQSLKNILPIDVLKKFQYATVNGKKRKFKEKFILPTSEFRLSLYSSTFRTQSFITNTQEIPSLQAELLPIAYGSCQTGFYKSDPKGLPSNTVISHKNCSQGFNEKKELSVAPKLEHSFIKKPPHALTNKWLWIGAGVLAGALIINSQKDSGGSPNTTVGF